MNTKTTGAKKGKGKRTRIERGLEVRAGWWDRLLDKPLAWALIAVLGCWWLLQPAEGPKLPSLIEGEIAANDIVVPSDVTAPDLISTAALREEARGQVPPVYDLDPSRHDDLRRDIRTLFSACRQDEEGFDLETLSLATGLDLAAEHLSILREAECSADLENAVIQAIDTVASRGAIDDLRGLERRGENGVVIRNLSSGSERNFEPNRLSFIDRREIAEVVRDALFEFDVVHRRWITPLVGLLEGHLETNVVFNRAEWQRRQDEAAAAVGERSRVFKRGQVLLRRGDRVTAEVLATIALFGESRSDLVLISRSVGVLGLLSLLALAWWQLSRVGPAGDFKQRLTVVLILMLLAAAAERAGLEVASALALSRGDGPVDLGVYLWALPHATGAVAALMLLGTELAVLFAVCQALLVGVLLEGDFTAMVFALGSALVATVAVQRFQNRAVFTRAGMLLGLANLILFAVLQLWGGLALTGRPLVVAAICAFIGGPLGIAVTSFVLPLLEEVFGITTQIRLLELSNQNLPLLKRLSLEGPGTYQHSLAVGNLAEAGSDAIGANSLLVRVSAYYHDIGKLVKPEYFVENQRSGINPHDNLQPSMSALVIISHVKEGLRMAREAKLPLPIRQAIATHHGTKLLHFFYVKAKEAAGEDRVDESAYRYPGPKPQTKELGILLLADAIEAASRTLDTPTPSRIKDLIDTIFKSAVEDGQLEESELTLKEIDRIASAFLWVLTNMYHHRIDYPGFDFNKERPRVQLEDSVGPPTPSSSR